MSLLPLSSGRDVCPRLDRLIDGPCWHWLKERSWIGIVGHGHVLIAVHQVLVEEVDLGGVLDLSAGVEETRI